MALPDFLVIGVPKAGTTALHAALVPHPQLFLPDVKETKFFLSDGPPPTSGGPGDAQTYQEHIWRREDYEALFDPAPAGTLRGEATPFYLYDLDAHERMRKLVPDAKLIAILRNPVDRAYSNWAHLWAAGLEAERDFVTACRQAEARKAAGWAAFWHYIDQGLYGRQLEHLLRYFPREQVFVTRYRDLREDPVPTLDRICEFLGVRTGLLKTVPRENVRPYVADTPLNTVLRGALRTGGRFGKYFPVPVRRLFSGPLLRNLQHGPRPRLTDADRAAILPAFVEDVALLERLTGERFDDWLALGTPVVEGAHRSTEEYR